MGLKSDENGVLCKMCRTYVLNKDAEKVDVKMNHFYGTMYVCPNCKDKIKHTIKM